MRVFMRFAVAAVSVAVLVPSVGAAGAEAAARPLAALKVSTLQVETGAAFTATFSVGHIPLHSKVVLQRTFGTARAWRTQKVLVAKTLKAKYAGTVAVTAPSLGSYGYRVLVLSSKSKALVTAGRTVHVFGPVTMSQLTNQGTSTYQIGGTLFRYVFFSQGGTDRFLHLDSTTCRTASLQFAASSNMSGGELDVVQETADPITLMVGRDAVTSAVVALSGGAVDFSMEPTAGSDTYDYGGVFANGMFDCWTTTGTVVTNS